MRITQRSSFLHHSTSVTTASWEINTELSFLSLYTYRGVCNLHVWVCITFAQINHVNLWPRNLCSPPHPWSDQHGTHAASAFPAVCQMLVARQFPVALMDISPPLWPPPLSPCLTLFGNYKFSLFIIFRFDFTAVLNLFPVTLVWSSLYQAKYLPAAFMNF